MYTQPHTVKVKPGSELARLLDKANEKPLLLEKDGVVYRVTAEDQQEMQADDRDPQRVKAGLRKSAGALAGVDTKQLLADIHAAREQRSWNRSS